MNQYKDIRLQDIIISDKFKRSKPSKHKLSERQRAYETGDLFDTHDIVINESDVLMDGYITYLTLLHNEYSGNIRVRVKKNMGKPYTMQPTMYVFGKHTSDGKEYVWRIPNNFREKEINIPVGSQVFANTKYGKKDVKVTRVEVLDRPPVSCRVKELATW